MKLVCPRCKTSGSAADSLAGREVTCPSCGEKFTAASEQSPPQPSAVESSVSSAGSYRKQHRKSGENILLPPPRITISGIIKESWQLSRNRRFALICRVGTVLLIIAMVALTLLLDSESGLIMTLLKNFGLPAAVLGLAGALLTVISMGISGNAEAGLPYLGIRHGSGRRVGLATCFRGFSPQYFKPLFVAGMMKTVLTMLGFLLLVVPGFYLSVAYWFAMPLILDRGLAPWQALELSRQAVTRVWFQIFGVYFVMVVFPFLIPGVICGYKLGEIMQKIKAEQLDFGGVIDMYAMFSGEINIIALCCIVTLIVWMFLLPCFFASYGVLYHKLFAPKKETEEMV